MRTNKMNELIGKRLKDYCYSDEFKRMLKDQLEQISYWDIYREVREEINSERFIDDIVERINKKQVGR